MYSRPGLHNQCTLQGVCSSRLLSLVLREKFSLQALGASISCVLICLMHGKLEYASKFCRVHLPLFICKMFIDYQMMCADYWMRGVDVESTLYSRPTLSLRHTTTKASFRKKKRKKNGAIHCHSSVLYWIWYSLSDHVNMHWEKYLLSYCHVYKWGTGTLRNRDAPQYPGNQLQAEEIHVYKNLNGKNSNEK